MRLLLDTHILLWRLAASPRVSEVTARLIDEQADAVFASAASVWEVAIKWSLRRGAASDMPLSGSDFLTALEQVGLEILPITPAHAAAVERLPMLHGDPFDRLLIAQARCEGLALLTADAQLVAYGDGVRFG
ncbi:MAG: type II toxin-antitoxin system VapC family toxin [Alteraurantiacibacter sp.]